MILRLALTALVVLSTVARADDPEADQRALEKARQAREQAVEQRAQALEKEAHARARAHARTHVRERADAEDEGTVSTDTTVSVRLKTRLELEDFGGSIAITGWDRNAVRVRAEHEPDTRIELEMGAATLVVAATRELRIPILTQPRKVRVERINFPATVDYELTVPRWMGLRLSGVNTDITIEGVENEVTAETVTGSVSLRGGKGNIRLNSINGGVEVVGARALLGTIQVGAVNDDIVVRDVIGRVRAEAVNGDVDLSRVISDDVEVSTVSGDVRYDGTFDDGGNYHFASHSGDLVVLLPERPDVAVTVDTFSGEFLSSFPVQLQGTKHGKQFSFTLGAGRAELGLESFSGTIRLVRRSVPAPPSPPARPARPTPPTPPTPPGK